MVLRPGPLMPVNWIWITGELAAVGIVTSHQILAQKNVSQYVTGFVNPELEQVGTRTEGASVVRPEPEALIRVPIVLKDDALVIRTGRGNGG